MIVKAAWNAESSGEEYIRWPPDKGGQSTRSRLHHGMGDHWRKFQSAEHNKRFEYGQLGADTGHAVVQRELQWGGLLVLNPVLWTIDHELDGKQFERLAADLLFRHGFRYVVPIEPQDAGRDAEEGSFEGRGRLGELCFFQFSLEDDWKGKLRRTMQRFNKAGHKPSHLVFVTSQKARGVDRDKLEREAMETYGCNLTIFSREWLRLQLEEAHPDLAYKYLGIKSARLDESISPNFTERKWDASLDQIRPLLDSGNFALAASELAVLSREEPLNPDVWKALAWSQYRTYHYDEAITSINRAIDLLDSPVVQSIRACILTERGIRTGDHASIIEARDIFLWVVEQKGRGLWVDWYNLGNAHSALGRHDAAIVYYIKAAELAPHECQVWKNLASAYHMLGCHDKEIECLDQALTLDPLKPEALISKGISLIVDFDRADHAIPLLEKAVALCDNWATRWPHIWYWLTRAYVLDGRYRDALKCVGTGLRHMPGSPALREQKSDVLVQLMEIERYQDPGAEQFWERELVLDPNNYAVRKRLVQLKAKSTNEAEAWHIMDEAFVVLGLMALPPLSESDFELSDAAVALEALPLYLQYRKYRPLQAYRSSENEGYLGGANPLPLDNLEKRLNVYTAIPFGLLAVKLKEISEGVASESEIRLALEAHSVRLIRVITEASRDLSQLIPVGGLIAETSDAIAHILTFLSDLGLREVSAQAGFLSGRLQSAPLQEAVLSFPYQGVYRDILTGCLHPLNEEVHFVSE